jgi:hypothetical protein
VVGLGEEVREGGLRVGNVSEGRDGSGFEGEGDTWEEDKGDASGGEPDGEYVVKGGVEYEREAGIGDAEPEEVAFDLGRNRGGLRYVVASLDEDRGVWPSHEPWKFGFGDLLDFRPSIEDADDGVLEALRSVG